MAFCPLVDRTNGTQHRSAGAQGFPVGRSTLNRHNGPSCRSGGLCHHRGREDFDGRRISRSWACPSCYLGFTLPLSTLLGAEKVPAPCTCREAAGALGTRCIRSAYVISVSFTLRAGALIHQSDTCRKQRRTLRTQVRQSPPVRHGAIPRRSRTRPDLQTGTAREGDVGGCGSPRAAG